MSIPGVVLSGSTPVEAPIVLVIAREKTGKSTLAATLMGWPREGFSPLVLAFDPTGPDSARRIGVQLPHIKVKDEPGDSYLSKIRGLASKLEGHTAVLRQKYSSIVIDCASTMADKIFDEAQRNSNNTNPKSHYGDVLNACSSFYYRIADLGLPVVWISWLREPENVADKGVTRYIPGGPHIIGSFREKLAGKVQAIVMLDKTVARPGDPNASSDGHIRRFHTRPFAGVNCESRYALPNPMKAHLGWLLHYIMNGYDPSKPGDQGGAL